MNWFKCLEKINDVSISPLDQFMDNRGWLAEIYREDTTPTSLLPKMAYVSITKPGVVRGPHQHTQQSDLFAFVYGIWWVKLWDVRQDSPTYKTIMRFKLTIPAVVIVPPGVVHAYGNAHYKKNGIVFNLPNQLFKGQGKKNPVDEIRHEENPAFNTDDISNQHWISQFWALQTYIQS